MGGEVFAEFEFGPGEDGYLPAFVAVRNLLAHLIEHGMIGTAASRHLRHPLDETPWLYHAVPDGHRPVRDNVDRILLDQFRQVVAGHAVDELWIHAPFHDSRDEGLRQLLTDRNPRRATLLVQGGRTSADAESATWWTTRSSWTRRCRSPRSTFALSLIHI